MQPGVTQQIQDAYGQANQGFGNQLDGGFAAGLQGQVGPNSYTDAMKGMVAEDAQRMQETVSGTRRSCGGTAVGLLWVPRSGRPVHERHQQERTERHGQHWLPVIQPRRTEPDESGRMMDQNQQFGTSNLQNMQQGAMNQFNPSMVGMHMANHYAQAIGGPTALTTQSSGGEVVNNSSSFNQGTSNNMGMNTGFSNGMNVGMNQSGGFNNGYGYGASNGQVARRVLQLIPAMRLAHLAFMSDARLKEIVEHVEQIDGVNLYTWDWREDAPVTSPMNYGVMAQEVAETHPEAVTTGEHGYMVVDYSKLGRAGEVALARMEG